MPVRRGGGRETGVIPFGESDYYAVYVYDTSSSSWKELDPVTSIHVEKRLSQLWYFEFSLEDVDDTVKSYLVQNARVAIYYDVNKLIIGKMQRPNYMTLGRAKVSGFSTAIVLNDAPFLKVMSSANSTSTVKRQQFDAVDVDTIVDEVLSTNGDGSSPWDMTKVSNATSFGNISVRGENINKLEFLANLADVMNYEWDVDTTDNNNLVDEFSLQSSFGTDKSATVIIDLTGNNAAIEVANKEIERETLSTRVIVTGYGDGDFQEITSFFAASDIFSTLSNGINNSVTTLTLDDASSFPANGKVIIGEEVITYSGKSSNNLTGLTRGATDSNSVATTAKAHPGSVLVFEYFDGATYYTPDSAKTDSNIQLYGLKTINIPKPEIVNNETLQLLASNYLLNHMTPINRITVVVSDVEYVFSNIVLGDTISVTDDEADISGNQRVVGIIFDLTPVSESVTLELSNVSLDFSKALRDSLQTTKTRSLFMQGAPTYLNVGKEDNLENPTGSVTANPQPAGMDLKFFIPSDIIAINSIKLSYSLSAPKIWSATTANESAHTHPIPVLTVNSTSTASSTASDGGTALFQVGGSSFSSVAISSSGFTTVTSAAPIWTSSQTQFVHIQRTAVSANPGAMSIRFSSAGSGGGTRYAEFSVVNNASFDVLLPLPDIILSGSTIFVSIVSANSVNISGNFEILNYPSHSHPIPGLTVNGSTTISSASSTGSAHTHVPQYDLSTQAYGASDIRIFTTNDSSSAPTWIERTAAIETFLGRALNSSENSTESNIPLTNFFSGNGWKSIRVIANGDSRVDAQSNSKVFIESR